MARLDKMILVHNCFPFTLIHFKLCTKTTHESWMCPIDFGVKGQSHNALITENGLCRIISFPLHLSSWNFIHRLPMSGGCVLWVLGSKGQRQGLNLSNYCKWFMLHNFFPFTPIIMKLHTKTPLEVRMCPKDFGVKRSKVKVTMHW